VYDGTALEYRVAQDEECRLLTVGSWYAMTGYAAAFPRNSKHFTSFNKKIMDYSENGTLNNEMHLNFIHNSQKFGSSRLLRWSVKSIMLRTWDELTRHRVDITQCQEL